MYIFLLITFLPDPGMEQFLKGYGKLNPVYIIKDKRLKENFKKEIVYSKTFS